MRTFDVIIVGGGVSGTSLLHELALHSNVNSIAIIEKYSSVAQVNSHPANNAQTSHEGDTETNYSPDHARKIKYAAQVLRAYVEKRNVYGLFRKTTRMALALDSAQVHQLKARFEEIKGDYPHLRFVDAEGLCRIEPMIMNGRDPNQPVAALVTSEGYAINYQKLAQCFLEDALKAKPKIDVFFDTTVEKVSKAGAQTILTTDKGDMLAKVVIFAAGAYSLHFAHRLGIAKNLAIHSIAGNFWYSRKQVNGKIYPMQDEGIPFSAIHVDPDVTDPTRSRLGPTTKWLPLFERHHYWTMIDFLRSPITTWRGIFGSFGLLLQKKYFAYIAKNLAYDIPIIGKWLFLQKAREIIPTLRYRDLKKIKGAGGTRPQIFNLVTGELEMGDKTIVGSGCIFNTTPSPGASVCLANAQRDATKVIELLNMWMQGSTFHYDHAKSRRNLGLENKLTRIA